MSVSKSVRFEVFQRDGFTCQYCGRCPPTVVLECDHVIPRSKKGADAIDNLITACFDCNRGKGARSLGTAPLNVTEKHRLLKERRAQVRAYKRLIEKQQRDREIDVRGVEAIFEEAYPDRVFVDSARDSIRQFLEHLRVDVVEDAMRLACKKMPQDTLFRYFCGICWRRIRGEGPPQ